MSGDEHVDVPSPADASLGFAADTRHFSEREPWEYWDGSYQQAYLNGFADATNHPPIFIADDPYPSMSLISAWQVLGGYLEEAGKDGAPLDARDVLSLMRDEKDRAYAEVRAWWERHRGPDGLPEHEVSS